MTHPFFDALRGNSALRLFGYRPSRGDPRGAFVVGIVDPALPATFWVYEYAPTAAAARRRARKLDKAAQRLTR